MDRFSRLNFRFVAGNLKLMNFSIFSTTSINEIQIFRITLRYQKTQHKKQNYVLHVLLFILI
jgi:hypothetical protein